MFGGAGIARHGVFEVSDIPDAELIPIMLALFAVLILPNTQEFMRDFNPLQEPVKAPAGRIRSIRWSPQRIYTWGPVAVLFALALMNMSPHRTSEFLYFQF